jgi:hypothetical protein
MHSNVSACRFWARAIPSFTGQAIHPVLVDKDGKCWRLFSFDQAGRQQKLGNDARKGAKQRRQKLMPEVGEPE